MLLVLCALSTFAQTRVKADQIRNYQQTYTCVDDETCVKLPVTLIRLAQINTDGPFLADATTMQLAFAGIEGDTISNVCWIDPDGRIGCLTETLLAHFRSIPWWFRLWLIRHGR